MTPVAPGLTDLLAAALVFYTAVLFAISWWASGRAEPTLGYPGSKACPDSLTQASQEFRSQFGRLQKPLTNK
ncbi:MAG: hypothetical protein OEM05_16380 [Myxococcales bacterium]|nr:hypothetical protein [Myxococcales bacterium]